MCQEIAGAPFSGRLRALHERPAPITQHAATAAPPAPRTKASGACREVARAEQDLGHRRRAEVSSARRQSGSNTMKPYGGPSHALKREPRAPPARVPSMTGLAPLAGRGAADIRQSACPVALLGEIR